MGGQNITGTDGLEILPGRVGLLANQAGIAFDDVQVRRVDWPAPATLTQQVHRGTFVLSKDRRRSRRRTGRGRAEGHEAHA